jgi:hypothetical protein
MKPWPLFTLVACFASIFVPQPQPTPTQVAEPTVRSEQNKPSPSASTTTKKETSQDGSSILDAKTVIAICALFVSIYFSLKAREHNRLSVKPMPYISQWDYENRIAIAVYNYGTGPMLLQKAVAETANRVGHLVDLIPSPPDHMSFSNFTTVVQPRPIRPGDHVDLLDLSINENDPRAIAYRSELREALGDMAVKLTYTDVYGSHFRIYSQKLDWFHRHRTGA